MKYDRYELNFWAFGLSFSVISVWTFLSLFYAFAFDEGTLGTSSFEVFMAESFEVWRFPSHHLLFAVIDALPFLSILFLPLLLFNVLFYCVIIERLTTFIRYLLARTSAKSN